MLFYASGKTDYDRLFEDWKGVEKPRDFDPFGQTGFAHLWLQYD